MQEDEETRLLGNNKDDEKSDRRDNDMIRTIIVSSELLRIAIKLDYSDEIGRRKVYLVVRESRNYSTFLLS